MIADGCYLERGTVTRVFMEANGVAYLMAKNGSSSSVFGNPMLYLVPPPFDVSTFGKDKLGTMGPRVVPICNDS